MKEKSAKEVKGFLLYNPFQKCHFFRVYNKKDKRKFTDYQITAEDIEIKILSRFNALIEKDGRHYLDYTSEVLGK
jgi:hypothetical protein